MKIITPEEWAAKEAARRASSRPVTKYSTLKIIRALGDQWSYYKNLLQQSGYLDQFFAANYLSSQDPVFRTFMQNVPQEIKSKLQECIWEAE